MACSLSLAPPCQLRLLAGQEHGRTIPLADVPCTSLSLDVLALCHTPWRPNPIASNDSIIPAKEAKVLPKIRNKGVASRMRSTAHIYEEETQEPNDPEDFPLGLLIDFACLV